MLNDKRNTTIRVLKDIKYHRDHISKFVQYIGPLKYGWGDFGDVYSLRARAKFAGIKITHIEITDVKITSSHYFYPPKTLAAYVYYQLPEGLCKEGQSSFRWTCIWAGKDTANNWYDLFGQVAFDLSIRYYYKVWDVDGKNWCITFTAAKTRHSGNVEIHGERIDYEEMVREEAREASERQEWLMEDLDPIDEAYEGDAALWWNDQV